MPVGYMLGLGIILAPMLMFDGKGSVKQPITAKPPAPTQIKTTPPPQVPQIVPPLSQAKAPVPAPSASISGPINRCHAEDQWGYARIAGLCLNQEYRVVPSTE